MLTFFAKEKYSHTDMDNEKSEKTQKWYREKSEIIYMYSGTRIRSSTTKWVMDNNLTYNGRFLEDIVKKLKSHTGKCHQIDIPEDTFLMRICINDRKW